MSSSLIGPDFLFLVIIAMLVVASSFILRLGERRMLREIAAGAREQLESRLEGFTGAVAALEARVRGLEARIALLTRLTAGLPGARAHAPTAEAAPVAHTNGTAGQPAASDLAASDAATSPNPVEAIPVEILILISAAVTSFLGTKVRIRSAKMLQSPYEIVNPWSRQGRVFVQASHAGRPWNRPAEPRGRIGPGVRH